MTVFKVSNYYLLIFFIDLLQFNLNVIICYFYLKYVMFDNKCEMFWLSKLYTDYVLLWQLISKYPNLNLAFNCFI